MSNTPYSVLVDKFLRLVENDEDFFDYYNLTKAESLALAKRRALGYLDEAVGEFILRCHPSVDFSNKDDESQTFLFEMNMAEQRIMPNLMYEMYLKREINKLKNLDVNYAPSDLRVFSPNDARTSFLALYKTVCDENEVLLNEYSNTDRDTGSYAQLDIAKYDSEES